MNTILFCDLARANKPLQQDIERAISSCIDLSSFLRGSQTNAFEDEWADYCGQSYAVCCNSGTDALALAASALSLARVTVQANTLPLTAIGLHLGGASVHVGEVSESGKIMSAGPDHVPVLMFGRLPDPIDPVYDLYDAAHAHGWKPPVSSVAAWSFYPTKTLGAFGDAGAITTNDRELAKVIKDLCGRDDQLRNRRQITSRIDEIQAAVLRVKLRYLDEWLLQRAEIGQYYDQRLKRYGITLDGVSLHHLYAIRVEHRDELMAFMKSQGVETKIHWAQPLSKIEGPWHASGDYQNAEAWSKSILSLPCYPGLTRAELNRICTLVEEFVNSTSLQKHH